MRGIIIVLTLCLASCGIFRGNKSKSAKDSGFLPVDTSSVVVPEPPATSSIVLQKTDNREVRIVLSLPADSVYPSFQTESARKGLSVFSEKEKEKTKALEMKYYSGTAFAGSYITLTTDSSHFREAFGEFSRKVQSLNVNVQESKEKALYSLENLAYIHVLRKKIVAEPKRLSPLLHPGCKLYISGPVNKEEVSQLSSVYFGNLLHEEKDADDTSKKSRIQLIPLSQDTFAVFLSLELPDCLDSSRIAAEVAVEYLLNELNASTAVRSGSASIHSFSQNNKYVTFCIKSREPVPVIKYLYSLMESLAARGLSSSDIEIAIESYLTGISLANEDIETFSSWSAGRACYPDVPLKQEVHALQISGWVQKALPKMFFSFFGQVELLEIEVTAPNWPSN